MENSNFSIVRKINLEQLIDALQELYTNGVEFVDLSGQSGEKSDIIIFSFSKDYMHEDFKGNFEGIDTEGEEPSVVNVKLSDDDINQIS